MLFPGLSTQSVYRTLTSLMVVCVWVTVTTGQTAEPDKAPSPAESEPVTVARPETTRLSPDQKRDLNLLMGVLTDAKIDQAKRFDAAASLIARNWPTANEQLAEQLNRADPTTRKAIALALARSADPPRALIAPLIQLIGSSDAAVREAVASALGRYEDPQVMQQLITIAGDTKQDFARRLGAIEALAEHRQAPSVEALVNLVRPGGDRQVIVAAAQALQKLTGITRFSDNPAAWGDWWTEHKHLPHERWLGRLTRSLGVRVNQLEQQQVALTDRLSDVYNRLYTATEPAQRPVLLREMLHNPTAQLRLLALELIERSLLSAEPINDETRAAMREKLTDADALVRTHAAALLRDLGDEPAAVQVASLLLPEATPSVQAAYLSLLSRVPQDKAIDPALVLLARPALRTASANFLIVAVEAKLFSPAQQVGVLKLSRDHLAKAAEPDPAVIRLLGKIGDPADAPTLVKLLDHQQLNVRRAAGEAFLGDHYDPAALLAKLGDASVADQALAVAARRGNTPQVIEALLAHEPANGELKSAWDAAVVAVANRLPLPAMQRLDDQLARQPARKALRLSILQAISQPKSTNGETLPDGNPERLVLILRYADLLLQAKDTAAARPLYDRLAAAKALPAAYLNQVRAGQVQTALADGAHEQAITVAKAWIAADASAKARVGTWLLDAAEAALTAKQTEQAAALTGHAAQLAEASLSEADTKRMNQLREQIKARQTPPADKPGG